jgi:hypothetical protein
MIDLGAVIPVLWMWGANFGGASDGPPSRWHAQDTRPEREVNLGLALQELELKKWRMSPKKYGRQADISNAG